MALRYSCRNPIAIVLTRILNPHKLLPDVSVRSFLSGFQITWPSGLGGMGIHTPNMCVIHTRSTLSNGLFR